MRWLFSLIVRGATRRRSKKLRAGSFLQAVYLAVSPGLEVTTHAVVQRLGEEQAKGRTVTLQSVSATLGELVKKRLLWSRAGRRALRASSGLDPLVILAVRGDALLELQRAVELRAALAQLVRVHISDPPLPARVHRHA
jgi:hypothetical protein